MSAHALCIQVVRGICRDAEVSRNVEIRLGFVFPLTVFDNYDGNMGDIYCSGEFYGRLH